MEACIVVSCLVSVFLSVNVFSVPKGALGLTIKGIAKGTEHISFRLEHPEPIAVHVVRAPRQTGGFILIEPVLANVHSAGLRPIHSIAGLASIERGCDVIAAINGGFFMAGTGTYRMSPIGLFVWRGELISPPNSRSALVCWDNGKLDIERLSGRIELQMGNNVRVPIVALNQGVVSNGISMFTPRFGQATLCPSDAGTVQIVAEARNPPLRPNGILRAAVSSIAGGGSIPIPGNGIVIVARGTGMNLVKDVSVGDELCIRTEVNPSKGGIIWALGAGPRLLRDGGVSVEWQEENFKPDAVMTQYPRAAVGLSDSAIVFVALEGDRVRGGRGVDAFQLAQLMRELGCTDALMLDCGSTTSMYVRGEVFTPLSNLPRPIANALVLFDLAPVGKPVKATIEPSIIHALPGAKIPIKVWLEDDACHRIPVRGKVEFEVDGDGIVLKADGTPTIFVSSTLSQRDIMRVPIRAKDVESGLFGEAQLVIHRKPKRLFVIPNRIVLEPSEKARIELLAESEDGFQLHYNPEAVAASFDAPIALFDASSMSVIAGRNVGSANLTLMLCGVNAHAKVHVGKRWGVIEEFNSLDGFSVRCIPDDGSVKAHCEIVSSPAYSGERAARLSFNFAGGSATRAAYLVLNRKIGAPLKLRCAVFGDGSGVWLRVQLRDASGGVHRLTLTGRVSWMGEWRMVEVDVPSDAPAPLTLDAIYVVATRASPQTGSIIIDRLSAQYPFEG